MEPEQPTTEQHPLTHTYQDDLAKAMNATEAPVVQKLLADARERETLEVLEADEKKEQKWYSTTSSILLFLTLIALGYGTYHYLHLTVPVQPAASVGVFQNSDSIVASSTTLQQVLTTYTSSTTLPVGKPTLINLVTDQQTNTLIPNSQLYSFIGATVPEPLQGVISSVRLGVVNTGKTVYPFIVASVADPEKASKEFGIAEPTLLQLFSPALNIDTTQEQNTIGQSFQTQYFYNLPVRTITNTDPVTGQQQVVFLYGYATNNVLVITSQPDVLKAVYDSIINQQ